jgi:hypothetical protein
MQMKSFMQRIVRGALRTPYSGYARYWDMRRAMIPVFLTVIPFLAAFLVLANLGFIDSGAPVWWPLIFLLVIWLWSFGSAYLAGASPAPVDVRAAIIRYGILVSIIAVVLTVVIGCGGGPCR